MLTKDCINWPVASTGIESCLRKQNRVIEKFYANPKVFGSTFYTGLRVKWALHFSSLAVKLFLIDNTLVWKPCNCALFH